MNNDLDIFLDSLQEEIFDEAREAFGEAGFDRWRNPRFNSRMTDYDTFARLKGECGDTMEIYLKFDNNRVQSASYFTDGCASSAICGSFTSELAIGRELEALTDIDEKAVMQKVGKLPEEDQHCAFLAASTLQEALRLYLMNEVKNNH